MAIEIAQLLEGAQQATGLTVIIDVFRAFSTACYLQANHAARIVPVLTAQEAHEIKASLGQAVLLGEVNGKIIPGFDYGNSPAHIKEVDFSGKTVIHRSSSGTQGLLNAVNADEVITGSLVNAEAIVRYIRAIDPPKVTLVCMGWACEHPSAEDTLCARYIQARLQGTRLDIAPAIEALKSGDGKRFFLPENQHSEPEEDFYLCTRLNQFDFVLQRRFSDQLRHYYLHPIAVPAK